MSRQWLPTIKKYFFSYLLHFVLVLNALIRLIFFSSAKPTMQQHFHPSAKHLLYTYITPSFVGHSFHVKGETWYFLPIHRCAFLINLKYIFVSLCKCSRTLRI